MKRLVLVGGGHAHVEVLRRFARQPERAVELVLVSPADDTPYSGMLPGLVAGHYRYGECHLDLRVICVAARARFVRTRATAIDPDRRTLVFASGATMHYDVASLDVESPVTTPCRVVAQMVNYRSHAQESGFDPAKIQPTFFRKASGSVVGPTSDIVKPAHVRLLDYEIELALVLKKAISGPITVSPETLGDHVFGITIANDVSARDVQLPQTQFFKGKSYQQPNSLLVTKGLHNGPALTPDQKLLVTDWQTAATVFNSVLALYTYSRPN